MRHEELVERLAMEIWNAAEPDFESDDLADDWRTLNVESEREEFREAARRVIGKLHDEGIGL